MRKDYKELIIKPQFAWLKKHRKGYLVILIPAYTAGMIYLYWFNITSWIRRLS